MIDMESIKFMLPHYVKDEFLADGSNSVSVLEPCWPKLQARLESDAVP
jgi:hypothetical protein